MIKKLHTLILTKKTILLSACIAATGLANAQTVTLFRSGVIILPRFGNLKDAIAAALPDDSLVLSPVAYKESSLLINKNLKITGTTDASGSSFIDAESKGRVMLITSGNVSLTNLLVTNGKIVNDAGGGICNYGTGTLTLAGTSGVTNSRTEGIYAYGGGIYSAGKVLILGDAYVSNNYAEEVGGGVYAYTTFFLGNKAKVAHNTTAGSGGGVFSRANGGATITDQARIEYNTAAEAGGGIFGPCTISRYAGVMYNKAESGGGIAAFSDAVFVKDSVQVSYNEVTNSGGAIWLNNANLYTSGYFEIMNNKVIPTAGKFNFGGAIYNVNGTINLNGGNIIGNVSPVATIYTTSLTKNNLYINACYIYNPGADGKRVQEAITYNPTPLPAGSVNELHADSTWWGQNNFGALLTGLSVITPHSNVEMNWSVNEGLPLDPTATDIKIEAHFKFGLTINMGSQYFRRLKATYKATNGSFTDANPFIKVNTNYITSIYKSPGKADTVDIIAWVDADTLKLNRVPVPANLSVKNIANSGSIRIYPNPADETLFISDASEGSAATLYSMEGRIVLQQTIRNKTEQLPLSNLPSGIYILQLTDLSGQKVSAQVMKK